MRGTTLIFRSLWYYRRTNLAAALCAAVATTAVVGALLVGDSVRRSLRDAALTRLGTVQTALSLDGRYFPAMMTATPDDAPVLHLRGSATARNDRAAANGVNILGVGKAFWRLGGADPPALGKEGVILNSDLAGQLGVAAGDEVTLQISRPGLLPRSGPMGALGSDVLRVKRTVWDIVGPQRFGRYSLRANQTPPYNAFVPLSSLGHFVGLGDRANTLLVAGTDATKAQRLLRKSFTIVDAGLSLQQLPDKSGLELTSDRVFLAPEELAAARRADYRAAGVIAYFVNELRLGDRAAPYSVVAAVEPPLPTACPPDLKDDEIVIHTSLAEDLDALPGDRLTMTYFVLGVSKRLEEASRTFRIRQVVPIAGAAADRTLMPHIPGITDVDDCRNWPSRDIRTDRIRPRDEDYWKTHRGTPKAFVTPAAARDMWANRYGTYTAVRYPGEKNVGGLAGRIARELDPAALGMSFVPVRQQALAAGQGATDFAGLFAGLSMFLVAAALLLTGLVFALGIEQRREQTGLLQAVGLRRGTAARMLLAEGAIVAVAGGLIGAAGGVGYTLLVLRGLSSVWAGAIASASISLHVTWRSVVLGAAGGTVAAVITMLLALWRQKRLSCRELLTGPQSLATPSRRRSRGRIALAGILTLAAALVLAAVLRTPSPEGLFLAGCACLIALLTWPPVIPRGLRLRGGRNRAVIVLIACATFLILAVAPFRKHGNETDGVLPPGTGGFALYAESATPILDAPDAPAGASILAMRLHEGDDASCLNLNRAQSPPILGVDPIAMAKASRFTLQHSGWSELNGETRDAVPAIADAATIKWALHSSVGESITIRDERGREVKLRFIAALDDSILQGRILISDERFVRLFPSDAGFRLLLVSGPAERIGAISDTLTQSYRDYGLSVEPSARRLAAFNRVQNTYLSIFVVLGLLGLALGVAGIAGVLARNVLERRGELAVRLAVGFRRRKIVMLIVTEHLVLLAGGMLIALVAGALPAMAAGVRSFAVTAAVIVLGIGGVGIVAVVCAALISMHGRLIDALRTE